MKNIVCEGFWSTDLIYDVNMSSIWSYLIRECGKLVEDYNSDIICDINTITNYIKKSLGDTQEKKVFWIGLRESGVDHEEFIGCRCNNDYFYRGVYKLTVVKLEMKCIVTLEKSSVYDFRKEHNVI